MFRARQNERGAGILRLADASRRMLLRAQDALVPLGHLVVTYRRFNVGVVLVSAAMLASCSGSGDGTTNADPGDAAESRGDDSPSTVDTVPGEVSTIATTAHSDSTDEGMDEALAALSAHVAELVATDRFAGAMLVARDGEVVFEDAWGLADREAGTPNTPETKFRIGSMNKMFTAVAVLQLVESRVLALDDPIGKYLTDYPNQELASTVTVRHLLTHTGGTGDFLDETYLQHRLELREHSDYIDLYGERPVRFEPGSRSEYSNYGFILLGALIEAVTSESYYDYVREHVFAPAGMTDTDSLPESDDVPGRAVGYLNVDGPYAEAAGTVVGEEAASDDAWVSAADLLFWRGNAAGGGYSTVGDLQRFADALTSGVLLSDSMLAEATRDQSEGYGFGFEVQQAPIHVYGHRGAFAGMNGQLLVFPELGYVVAALSNLDPPAAESLVNFFLVYMPKQR